MLKIIEGGMVYSGRRILPADIIIQDGIIRDVGSGLTADGAEVIDADGLIISPGFVDLHTHLREPGYPEKEDMASGTAAAARGGFTTVCSMPNLDPAPDCRGALMRQMDIIQRSASVHVLPYCTITKGERGEELSEIPDISPLCIGFSDDGKGVQNEDIMRRAMRLVKKHGSFIAAHCEDEALLINGGSVHEGICRQKFGVPGISSESEYRQIQRDIDLVRETGCRYHVCHISTAQGVEIIRQAKERGLPVTCEATPHHLALCDEDITEDDGRFKMNPPLRSRNDMMSLRMALADGTVDAIATDHAPHTAEQKSKGLSGSAFGISGLETAFAVIYTFLVKTGVITIERALELLTRSPAKIIGRECEIRKGAAADLTFINPAACRSVDPSEFLSKGKSTAFEGMTLFSDIEMTLVAGNPVYKKI